MIDITGSARHTARSAGTIGMQLGDIVNDHIPLLRDSWISPGIRNWSHRRDRAKQARGEGVSAVNNRMTGGIEESKLQRAH